jgi:hypothetical protein
MERMHRTNVYPVIAANMVAQYYMNPNTNQSTSNSNSGGTLMVILGAIAALQPTPTMMGYGCAKNTVHYLISTMGACTGGIPNTTFPNLKTSSSAHHNNGSGNNSNTGGGPMSNLQDSKFIRQMGRTVRKQYPSFDHLSVIGILPTLIDTNTNTTTATTTKADTASTPSSNTTSDDEEKGVSPYDIVQEIGTWITTPALRPHSGALIKVMPALPVTAAAKTTATTTTNQHNPNHNNSKTRTNGARFELVR